VARVWLDGNVGRFTARRRGETMELRREHGWTPEDEAGQVTEFIEGTPRIKLGRWVPYEPTDPYMREAGIPVKGDRVRVNGSYLGMEKLGLYEGTIGDVIASGRGTKASDRFTRNWKGAILAGRELTPEDYEPLIDSEGPVVRWPNGLVEWYPGQGMGAIELVGGYPLQ